MIASLSIFIVSFNLSIFSSVAGLGHFCQLAFFPFLLQTDWQKCPRPATEEKIVSFN